MQLWLIDTEYEHMERHYWPAASMKCLRWTRQHMAIRPLQVKLTRLHTNRSHGPLTHLSTAGRKHEQDVDH